MRAVAILVRLSTAVIFVASLAAGCGGSSPSSPTPNPGGGSGGGNVNTTTITINSSGVVTPNDITVSAGSRVTFVNNHNRNHEINSDPHPTHGDCPGIDQVGFIAPGQTKLTGNLTEIRVCGFHDHQDPGNASLIGRIRVQ